MLRLQRRRVPCFGLPASRWSAAAPTDGQRLTPRPTTPLSCHRECPVGQAPALLLSSINGCSYAECGKASALDQPADGSSSLPANAAAMAAPAIVLTLVVVAFVEVLMHFC